MVLVALLGMVGLLLGLVLGFSGDALHAARYLNTLQERERAYYAAASAADGLGRVLADPTRGQDTLRDPWYQVLSRDVEGTHLEIRVEDEERRFNANRLLAPSGESDEKRLAQFQRLLVLLHIREETANTLLDWMDEDDQRRFPGGAEASDYKDPPCKNLSLDSLEELDLLRGVQPEDLEGRAQRGEILPGLKAMLTAHSSGVLNLNTTPEVVLRCLDPEMDPTVAAEVVRRREEGPFEKVQDLAGLAGMNADLLYRIRPYVDVRSTWFRLEVTARRGPTTLSLTAVGRRQGQNLQFVVWKVE